MLEIRLEWLEAFGAVLFLFGYVAFQKHCWLNDEEDEEDAKEKEMKDEL
jgi:hypothetical protein